MKNNIITTRYFVLIGIFIALVIISVLIFNNNFDPSQNRPEPKPNHKLNYAGSIGYFESKKGIASFKQNYQKLDVVSLYWYQVNSEGSISRRSEIIDEEEEEVLTFAKRNKKKVLVGIENDEDAEKIDSLLEDKNLRKKHISKILNLLQRKGYDGVVVDYENLRQDQEKGFTEYMRELSSAVKAEGKIISISVNTETSGGVFHGIDIVEVSKVVDRLELNVYEEFGDETDPGPIASIDWVNTTIKNVIDQGVNPNKIILGTSHSGHDWVTSPNKEFFKDTTTKELLDLMSIYSANLKWNAKTQSAFFEYKDDAGKIHTVWLEDSRSFKAKIDLAKSYELQGMFIWYLGGEDPKVWNVLEDI